MIKDILFDRLLKKKSPAFKSDNHIVHIPSCPACGGRIDNIRCSRTINDEDPIFVYICGRCGNEVAYDTRSKKSCVVTAIDGGDDYIKKIFRRIVSDKDSYISPQDYSDIMNDNDLKTTDELLEFLANRYREGKTALKKKETPGLMTIDEAKYHIQFGDGDTILYDITITYQPEVYNTTYAKVYFYCRSFEELKSLWEEYIVVNDIYSDCIIGFDIDLSMEDQNYINRLKEAMGRLLREIKTDLLCKPMPTTEEALDALLSSEPFKDIAGSIIFPRVKHIQVGPNPEDIVKTVKRYYR